MATYLRQKVKKSTSSSSTSTRYASEFQEHGRKPIPDTAADDDYCSAADRARFLQNPAILDTLDSVHRSLLFNNLKFDTDEHTDGLDSTYTISREGVRKPSASYSRVPFSAPTTHVAEHDNKVNIAEASPDDRSSGTEVVLHEEELQYERCGGGGDCIAAANSYESLSLDDELAALFGRDWNNNLSGKAVASKVKMMVQQYERGKDGPVRTSAEHQTAVELRHPDVSSIGEAETSDFESASVTSGGSSVSGADGGRRSVRTSSAFSEGSRDVASIERFELGAVNQPQRQQQEELAAGHNTMITININYRCDTNNPPRTSKATCGEEVGAGAKNVDIVVSAPPGQAAREGGSRKSLKSDNAIEGATVERYVQAAVGGDVEEQELMDLEKEETEVTDGSVMNDSDAKGVELLPKDDAGTGSKMDHLAKERRRSSLTSNHHRPCYTPEDEEYHDCDDLHESTLSFYEQASSQPVTPQGQKQRSSVASASPVECADALDGEQPMIRIVQELSEDHAEVTSTITLSKEQVREMQKTNGARRSGESVEELKRHSPREEKSSVHEKRRKSSTSSSNGAATATKKRHDRSNLQRQQRIMDDNFCNEILDSTIHFDRLLGNARSQRHQAFEREKMAVSSPSPPAARPAAEECFSDSVVGELVSSPADESFDSVMSVGKLEGKPRYSGKTVGRLMMKRLKKLQGGGRDVPPKTINTSDASTSSSLQTSGPKKPPRTFAANSPKRVSAALPTPSCPTAKDVEGSDPSEYEIGWKLDSKPRTHQVGWKVPAASGKSEAIPAQIYSMLNYSEDESRRRLIKTGNSKPAPQQQSSSSRGGTGTAKYWHDGEPAGPKLDIDTVDGVKTPSRRHSTSTDFEKFVRESNVKSTPHRKSDAGSRAGDTRRRIELFLSEERQQQQQQQGPERKLPGADRRRRTTGGIFERRRQQQENFLDDARLTNHDPRRRKKVSKVPSLVAGGSKHACCSVAANAAATASLTRGNGSACSGGGKIEKRRTFRKAALLKRTRTLFEASKKKIWAIKKFETPKKLNIEEESGHDDEISLESRPDSVPIVREPLIVRERVEDRLSSVVRREDERFQQKPTGGTAAAGHRHRGSRREAEEQEEDVLLAFEKDIIVEEEMGGKNGKDGKGGNLILLKAHKSVQVKVEGGNGAAAPLGCFDTDGEIESLRKYNDREIEELVHSLHDNVTLSDVGTLDTETTASSSMGRNEIDHIGYDTVDLAPPPPRTLQKPASKNQTIDTVDVSELISHAPDDSLCSTSNLSPITGSLTSTKMSTTSGTAVMRNLKDKLRSSFRKSKTFIKNERQRLANYLEERTGSKSSSASSSAANSPRRRPVEQKTHFNTIGHTQSVQQSPARRRLECSEQEESDDMYRSFTDGSGSIVTAGSSMTELSSQHMSELMQQIIRQGDARKQLKQALGICRSTREFECSPELIEAERLLLVATQKETAVRNELNKIDYQTHGMTLAEGKRVGTVTLSNFEFPLKEAAVRDALFNYFYVVVCTYKHEVKATVAKERHADGRVYLRDCAIQFSNLDANYEIKVEVFVLQLRKNVKNYSFESRYHLEKDSKRPLSCPSPSKKLREAGRLLSFRSSSPKTFDFDNEFSRFKSQGFLTLTSFTLLTANGAAEGDDAPEEEKHFDATYATARTSHNTHLSTMLEGGDGDEELLAEGHSYYSTTGHFQPVVCRRGDDQSVLFIAEEFKYLTLDSMAYTSNMVGTIGMSVRSEVRFDGSDIAGFLDVGEKVEGSDESITWNRRWCKMNGFMLEFWNYPQECQEKQPILYIDLVKCINERIQLADRTICSRPRTLKVEIFASRVAAGAGASCNSSGIGSFRSTTGRTTSPSCSAGDQDRDGLLRPLSPGEQQRGGGGGSGMQSHNNVICYLLAADTQSGLKSWLVELNRVVKFLKEWKF
ncbi:uncharacterized protein LOC120894087 isoform X3 [Anopheles arabiensis]|uniref:uncharacterized protein LOC120894087 isoform X3 n=1 Tax=Anopheles arabiensis TaxID=7173 RepID=UPI001AADF20B|nr:uncharacterized protein LOC120894087 isoform X3 [Anopheles arabiensis]